jgi:hypothetical protein
MNSRIDRRPMLLRIAVFTAFSKELRGPEWRFLKLLDWRQSQQGFKQRHSGMSILHIGGRVAIPGISAQPSQAPPAFVQ